MKNQTLGLIIMSICLICFTHSMELSFSDYNIKYNKYYKDSDEYNLRQKIFKQNLEKIKKHNSNPNSTWKAAVNHLTDRTSEEINMMKGKNKDVSLPPLLKGFLQIRNIDTTIKKFPKNVDWRRKNVIPKIRDQGSCGSCWSFSAVATIESHLAIQTGQKLDLSEQQLVSCVENPRNCGGKGGCNGATEELGFDYITKYGLSLEEHYPYIAKDSQCNKDLENSGVVMAESFVKLPENDYNSLMDALMKYGPVAVSVDASDFEIYDSGIYDGLGGECGSSVNHAVVAVGFGTDTKTGTDYWIIRNSWGTNWGEKGYMRLKREKDASKVTCKMDTDPKQGSACDDGPSSILVCGTCGVLSDSSYPKGVKLVKIIK